MEELELIKKIISDIPTENVKKTQRIIQIKHIIFNFNVHNTS